jgi:hypothetical protein
MRDSQVAHSALEKTTSDWLFDYWGGGVPIDPSDRGGGGDRLKADEQGLQIVAPGC